MIISMMNDGMKSFHDLAVSFAVKELDKRREESDRYPFVAFETAVLGKAHELGFLGITLPEDLGGIGQGVGTLCVILEGISRTDASLGALVFTNALAQEIILRAGSAQLLGPIMSSASPGGVLIAFSAYSDPAEHKILPVAVKGKGGYAISGSANYVVLAPIAGHALIPARIAGQEGYSLFLVDLSDAKVKKSDPVFSLGVHACPVADITLSGAEAQLVGREGQGAAAYEEASNVMCAAAAAISLGIMRGSFDYALAYSNEREQGGWPIFNWSEIKIILSNMAVQMKVADLALSQACSAIENKSTGWELWAKAAALNAQDAACSVTTDGIQVLGGYGYMKDYGQEKRFRDAGQAKTLLGMTPLRKISLVEGLNAG
jgi:alkylation response protein AidB-like acyl-CoA dehydrogenase